MVLRFSGARRRSDNKHAGCVFTCDRRPGDYDQLLFFTSGGMSRCQSAETRWTCETRGWHRVRLPKGSILGNVNQVVFHFSGSRAANFENLKPTEHEKRSVGARNTQSPMLVTAAGLECQTIHTLSTCTFWLVSRWFPRALLVVVRVLCRTSCKSLGVWKLRATRCSSERKPREVACD